MGKTVVTWIVEASLTEGPVCGAGAGAGNGADDADELS